MRRMGAHGVVVEAGEGCHAYVQGDGSWGWSNAGLVLGDGCSLLVDTLFDLPLTAEMLAAFATRTATAPIGTVVNTHANGDHCYGNELVGRRRDRGDRGRRRRDDPRAAVGAGGPLRGFRRGR